MYEQTQEQKHEQDFVLAVLHKLYAKHDLSEQESFELFQLLFAGKLDPIYLSSLVTALKLKGEVASEVAGAALAMLKASTPLNSALLSSTTEATTIVEAKVEAEACTLSIGEIVGTGGDHANSINISTISAIVSASMGLHIAKHGNRAISSQSGAADLLQALGYNLECSREQSYQLLKEEGFAFIFAPLYHQAMRFAAPVRKMLATRTIFNVLGPLTNPARPNYALVGVYDPALLGMMAQTLERTQVERAFCVHGSGMDELTPFSKTELVELKDHKLTHGYLDLSSFGLNSAVLGTLDVKSALQGADPQTNAKIACDILSGQGKPIHNITIAMNVATLLYLSQEVADLKDAYALASEHLQSGAALKKLERVCQKSQESKVA